MSDAYLVTDSIFARISNCSSMIWDDFSLEPSCLCVSILLLWVLLFLHHNQIECCPGVQLCIEKVPCLKLFPFLFCFSFCVTELPFILSAPFPARLSFAGWFDPPRIFYLVHPGLFWNASAPGNSLHSHWQVDFLGWKALWCFSFSILHCISIQSTCTIDHNSWTICVASISCCIAHFFQCMPETLWWWVSVRNCQSRCFSSFFNHSFHHLPCWSQMSFGPSSIWLQFCAVLGELMTRRRAACGNFSSKPEQSPWNTT